MHPTSASPASRSCDAMTSPSKTSEPPILPSLSFHTMPQHMDARELWQVYRCDRLVLHTFPTASAAERGQRVRAPDNLLSASLVFYKGLSLQAVGGGSSCGGCGGHPVSNAVARFGPLERVRDTRWGTLHDLEAVWNTHAALEAQKPPDKRAPKPFLFFTDCDMCDVGNECGGLPDTCATSYLDAQWQVRMCMLGVHPHIRCFSSAMYGCAS